MKEEIILLIFTLITISLVASYTYEIFFEPKPPIKIEQYKFQDGTMSQKIPNDREERLYFLRNLARLRNKTNNENVKVKNRKFEKQYLHVKKLQDRDQLPFINIPEVMHTQEHGDLVFRIDKEKGTIRILKRVYEWDSDKDDINDE